MKEDELQLSFVFQEFNYKLLISGIVFTITMFLVLFAFYLYTKYNRRRTNETAPLYH